MCSSMKQKLLVPEDFNGSKSLNNRLSKIACLTNIEDLDQNELLIKNSSRYSELNHQCSSYIKNMGVNQRKMEKCLIKAITPLQNINDKEELLLPPDFTINYQDTGTQKLKINFHDPTSCTNTSFDNSNDSYFKINIPSDKLVYKKKMSVSCHPAIEQARIITNADKKSKVPLLTPDCFLSTGNTNSNYEDTLSKCVINELNLDENLLEIHKNSSKNCTNLISAGENFCSKPCRRIRSFQNYFDNQNEMNRVLPTSMEGIKESLPERIYTAHAKRKLDFENEENFIGIKTENKLPPEFKCSLHLSENVPVSCGSYYEEKKSESPIPYKTKKELPSIGVFWDIENCRVPKGLCATHVVQEIRNRFFDGYREAEFVCVCDTLKENPKVLEELNDAQVNIMHVGSIVKNAADDKLLQGMRRFADLHGSEATIILISGDSDFATELYDLRYRKRLHVILIHNAHAQDSLKLSAHETVLFSEVIQEVPLKNIKPKSAQLCRDITVWNIPPYIDTQSVRKRLHFLASNCGGKGIFVKNGMAKISFQTPELAARAKKRIEGEDVYGSKVACTFGKDCTTSKFKSPGFHGGFQDYTPITKPQLPVREADFLPESNFTHFESESKPPQRDCRNEQFGMDLNVGMWNKSSTISSASTMNMNGHSNYLNSTWGGMQSPTCQLLQEGGGGSYTSSPILHSSSQGSSRESSPHPFSFQKNNQDFPNRSSYRSSTNMQTKTGQHINDFRSLDDNRSPRMSQPWPSPYNKSNWPHSSQAQTDLQNQTLYSLGNLSMTETSRVSDNLEEENEDMNVTLVDRSYINDLWVKSRKILWDVAKCSLPIKEFQQIFLSKYTLLPKMEVLKKDLDEFIQVTSEDETAEVKLVPLQAFARDLLILLYEAGGRMLLVNFETAYLNRFGIACRPATLGFPNLVALVQSLGSLATIKGRGTKRIIVLEKDLNLELPTYCPPQPRNVKPVNRESSIWSGNNLPANPVPPPPPPNCSTSNSINPAPPPTPPCDHKFYHPDILNRHMMMGYTPPTPQPSYQPSSPVIYPGSPVAPNGSLVWGQMWSPQYSVMPPLSPAPHYMMPTIPINWGSIATSPILAPPPKPTRDEVKSNRRTVSPISIQTLDQLGKESPPNPSELPAPGIFSLNSVKHGLCSQDGNERLNATNNLTTSPSKTLKLINKRLAAHFDGTSTES